jgi:hypothetical protein
VWGVEYKDVQIYTLFVPYTHNKSAPTCSPFSLYPTAIFGLLKIQVRKVEAFWAIVSYGRLVEAGLTEGNNKETNNRRGRIEFALGWVTSIFSGKTSPYTAWVRCWLFRSKAAA